VRVFRSPLLVYWFTRIGFLSLARGPVPWQVTFFHPVRELADRPRPILGLLQRTGRYVRHFHVRQAIFVFFTRASMYASRSCDTVSHYVARNTSSLASPSPYGRESGSTRLSLLFRRRHHAEVFRNGQKHPGLLVLPDGPTRRALVLFRGCPLQQSLFDPVIRTFTSNFSASTPPFDPSGRDVPPVFLPRSSLNRYSVLYSVLRSTHPFSPPQHFNLSGLAT